MSNVVFFFFFFGENVSNIVIGLFLTIYYYYFFKRTQFLGNYKKNVNFNIKKGRDKRGPNLEFLI